MESDDVNGLERMVKWEPSFIIRAFFMILCDLVSIMT